MSINEKVCAGPDSNGHATTITPMGGGPARAINDSGQVVGGSYAAINNDGTIVGTINSKDGVSVGGNVTALSTLTPFAINNSGVIVGNYYDQGGSGGSNAGIYKDGVATNLAPSLSLQASNIPHTSYAYKINDSGDLLVASGITAVGVTPQTLLYNAATNSLTNISKLVGSNYTQGTGYYPGGQGAGPDGAALNNHDQIVGNGWLYSSGEVYALNSLIPASAGWNLTQGFGINDSGQIVGQGIINGQSHAFLLTPDAQAVPEPSTLAFFTLAMIGMGIRAFKKGRAQSRRSTECLRLCSRFGLTR